MPTTQSPKILAFIEGSMERLFVNNNFRYVEVIPLSNGSGWTIDALCQQIGTKFFTKNMNADQIIVWIDKEKQSCSNSEFCQRIVKELVSKGARQDRIHVCIPNRMTENIILADEEVIRTEFDIDDYKYIHEGQNGKSILSSMYTQKGINYKEMFHGVTMMKKIRLSRSAMRSESARSFLETFSLKCWWI